jgi:hypothetical protein
MPFSVFVVASSPLELLKLRKEPFVMVQEANERAVLGDSECRQGKFEYFPFPCRIISGTTETFIDADPFFSPPVANQTETA